MYVTDIGDDMNEVVKEIPFEFNLDTDGTGYWTAKEKEVKTTKLELAYEEDLKSDDKLFGELRIYFDTKTWDPRFDGLIYTDEQFMDDLRGCLEVLGLDDADVCYSEQGMQGNDYVSCDVGEQFITSWTFKEWAESELPGN